MVLRRDELWFELYVESERKMDGATRVQFLKCEAVTHQNFLRLPP
jgi:hypothetical protein